MSSPSNLDRTLDADNGDFDLASADDSGAWARYVPGDVIGGKYRLDQKLGQGGMGLVWRARNVTLDTDVAVKLIRSDRTSPEASERLLREARAAARIGHPSIVQVHDFGETSFGDPFIVMELLSGESLESLCMREQRMEATRAVQLLLPLCAALAEAHERDIVHRDLKPQNIYLVRGSGGTVRPKLLDFGIAKLGLLGEVPARIRRNLRDSIVDEDSDTRLTRAGDIMGSPRYLSPEQATGIEDVDARSDLWALMVVLYEMVTGFCPFQGKTVDALVMSVLRDQPTSITAFAAGDETLWGVIERGLRKNRQQRWQSAREMGVALAQWLLDQGVETDATGGSVRRHWLTLDETETELAAITRTFDNQRRRRWLIAGGVATAMALVVAGLLIRSALAVTVAKTVPLTVLSEPVLVISRPPPSVTATSPPEPTTAEPPDSTPPLSSALPETSAAFGWPSAGPLPTKPAPVLVTSGRPLPTEPDF